MSKFKPGKYSFVLVLSSPTHFVGEHESEQFLLTHVWHTFEFRGSADQYTSTNTRFFFALSFDEKELTQQEEDRRQPPAYKFVGDIFAVFLSLLYGKLFCNHGFLTDHGHFCLPKIDALPAGRSHNEAPFSRQPRKDVPIPLK